MQNKKVWDIFESKSSYFWEVCVWKYQVIQRYRKLIRQPSGNQPVLWRWRDSFWMKDITYKIVVWFKVWKRIEREDERKRNRNWEREKRVIVCEKKSAKERERERKKENMKREWNDLLIKSEHSRTDSAILCLFFQGKVIFISFGRSCCTRPQ